MDRRRLLTAGMATLAASALPAHAHSEDHQDIVGSWLGTVTATNPRSAVHRPDRSTRRRRDRSPATCPGHADREPARDTGHERGRGAREILRGVLASPAACRGPGRRSYRHVACRGLVRSTAKLDGTFESLITESGNVLVTVDGT